MDIKIKYQKSLELYVARISDGSRYGRQVYGKTPDIVKEKLQSYWSMPTKQNKDLQGDLQTARRESVSDRKRIEVEKFKSKLSGVESDTKAKSKIQANKLDNAVKLQVEKLGSAMRGAEEGLGSVRDIL